MSTPFCTPGDLRTAASQSSRKVVRVNNQIHGFSEASDDEFVAQVEALMALPIQERLAGLAAAEGALRERLGRAETSGAAEEPNTSS